MCRCSGDIGAVRQVSVAGMDTAHSTGEVREGEGRGRDCRAGPLAPQSPRSAGRIGWPAGGGARAGDRS